MEITSVYKVNNVATFDKAFPAQVAARKEEELAENYFRDMVLLSMLTMPAGFAIPYF
jgi:hypothetical protein